ncbi:MAG: hypothetical protein AB8C46_09065 [Burkholderiaceae bacterium]
MSKESISSVSAVASAILEWVVIAGSTAVVAGLSVATIWTLVSPVVGLLPRLLVMYS